MAKKGRAHRPTGTKNGQSKLTPQQVLEIYDSPLPDLTLARKYHLSLVAPVDLQDQGRRALEPGHRPYEYLSAQPRQSAQSRQA